MRDYAESAHIVAEITDLRVILQDNYESDNSFYKRINEAVVRCRNVHSTEDFATMFIEGLDATIRTLVAVTAKRTEERQTWNWFSYPRLKAMPPTLGA